MMKKGYLLFDREERFEGLCPYEPREAISGEVVFTTGMTGYLESLTDPSFAGQILVFTYPLIGNYGINVQESESSKIHARGVVISETTENFSHSQALVSLAHWLKKENCFLLAGVDTRRLVKMLRTEGSRLAVLTTDATLQPHFFDPNQNHIVAAVTADRVTTIGQGKRRIIAVDCGMKKSLLTGLLQFDVEIKIVPAEYDYSEEDFDGIFLSNGPGDPAQCRKTVEILQRAMQRKKPIFGVCLGCQLMALATGATTHKLKFGHRGQNVPAIDVKSQRCYITSQNHGFAVDEASLGDEWQVSFRNLNDNTVEGIEHRSLPFFAVQFHPEAAPGPLETRFLFERFYQCL